MSSGLSVIPDQELGKAGLNAMTGAPARGCAPPAPRRDGGRADLADARRGRGKMVSHAMVQLGSLEAETVERLIVDFVSRLSSGGGITSNYERTESLLLKIFPTEQVSAIMAEIKGRFGQAGLGEPDADRPRDPRLVPA